VVAIALGAPAQARGAGLQPVMVTGGVTAAPSYKDPGSRLSSRASALTDASARSAPAQRLALPASGPGSLVQVGGDVVVDVRAATTSEAFLDALRAAAARVLFVDDRLRTVTVAVAPADLARVAAVDGVRNVRPELAPFRNAAAACPAGNVISEADGQLRAAEARATFGVTGAGVKVGVISDSFDNDPSAPARAADDIAGADLPGAANPCGLTTPVDVLAEGTRTVDSDEGRAMLQVVHDLAPGASLAFASAVPETAFPARVQSLVTTHGARVIVDDISYADEPYFQDGPQAVAANAAVAAKAAYYSSAANNNFIQNGADRGSWEAPAYRNTTCPANLPDPEQGCMNFGTPDSPGNAQPFVLAPGGELGVDLQWAEPWFGVTTDLDAYLLDSTGSRVLAVSNDANPGADGTQQPFEFFSYRNTSSGRRTVLLVIGNFTGTTGPRLKWTLTQPSGSGVLAVPAAAAPGDITGPAIFGHNGAGAGMSVAAVPFDNAATVEGFSSRGPVTHYFGPVTSTTPAPRLAAPQVLAKPDVTATDGAATTFFGQLVAGVWRFFGTSQAAPHAAAVAALQMQLNPTLSATSIMAAQRSTAVPIPGFPAAAQGAGRLDAVGAVAAVKPAAPPATPASGAPAPPSSAPPPPFSAPAPPRAAPPPASPVLRIAARQRLSRGTVAVFVRCPQPCGGRITARMAIKKRRGTLALPRVAMSLAAGRSRTFKVAIKGRARKAARKALRAHRAVTVKLTITLNGTTTRRTVKLVA
jgi:Subtilase family